MKNIIKKFLLFSWVWFVSMLWFGFADSKCIDIEWDRVCLEVERNQDRYYVNINSNFGKEIWCQLKTPERVWSTIHHLPWCEDEIEYDWSIRWQMSIYMYYGDSSQTFFYDIRNDQILLGDDYKYGSHTTTPESPTNYRDIDWFVIDSNTQYPSENQNIRLQITAIDRNWDTVEDYQKSTNMDVYYKRSSSSSWIKTTSSSLIYVSDWTPNFDDGISDINVRFRNDDYDYKIVVRDSSSISNYKIFYLSRTTTTNNNVFWFDLKLSDYSVEKRDYIDFTLTAIDYDKDKVNNYNKRVYFFVEKKVNWRRTNAYTSDFGILRTNYTFYNDNGDVTFPDFLRFYQDGVYRLGVYESGDDDIRWYSSDIVVWDWYTQYSDLNYFGVSYSKNDITSTNEMVYMYISAFDRNNNLITNYQDNTSINVYYKTSNSSSWIQTTSDSNIYVSDRTPNFQYWKSTIGIIFKKNYDYKITLSDWNVVYDKIFYVNTYNSTSTLNNFVSVYYGDMVVWQRNNIRFRAIGKDGNIMTNYKKSTNLEVYYKRNNSNSWIKTTSSSLIYVSDRTPNFDNGISDIDVEFKNDMYDYKLVLSDWNIVYDRVFYLDNGFID